MKKKSLYLAGVALLAAVGFSAITIAQEVTEPSTTGELTCDAMYPANGEEIYLPAEIGIVYFDFNTAGDAGITINTESKLQIQVIKDDNYDGKFAAIEANSENLSVSPDNNKRLVVTLGKNFTAGEYKVIVPAGIVSGVLPDGESAGATGVNAAVESKFTVYGILSCGSMYPATGEVVSTYPGISAAYFSMTIGGDEGLSINKNQTEKVIVTKDDQPFAEYEVNSANVYVDRLYQMRLMVNFGENLAPGVYKISVPANVVRGLAGGGDDSMGAGIARNDALENTFTVKAGFPYTFTPAAGSELMASDLATVKVSYEDNVSVSVANANLKAKLYNICNGAKTQVTTYSLAAEKNVVTLTADSINPIKASGNGIDREWNYIEIPQNVLNITSGAENTTNTEMEIGNWAVRNFSADALKFIPALDDPNVDLNTLEELTMILPEGCEWATPNDLKPTSTAAMVTVYTKPYLMNASYGYKFKSISEDGLTIVMQPIVQTSATASNNNPKYCQAGPSAIRINQKKIKTPDGTLTAQLDIDAWDLKGIEYNPIYNSTPANGGIISATSGLASLTVNVLRASYVADENAEITLTKDGVVLKSVKASATTTANAKDASKGATSIAFSNLFKNESGVAYKDPGVYKFHIPAGAFKQVGSEWTNNEYDFEAYIPKLADFTASPAPVTTEGTTAAAVTYTVNEDINVLDKVTLTFPDAAKVELCVDYAKALANSVVGRITYANVAKINAGTSTSFTTASISGYSPNFSVKVVGTNQVELSFNPMEIATPKNYMNAVKFYQGMFTITNTAGETFANPTFGVIYQPFGVAAPVCVSANLDSEVSGAYLQKLLFKGAETIYNPTNAKMTLQDANGETIATYTASAPTEEEMTNGLSAKNIWFTTETDLTNLPNCDCKLIIEKETIQVGNASASSPMVSFNTEDFVYDIKLKNFIDPETVSPVSGSTVDAFSYVTLNYAKKGGDDVVDLSEGVSIYDKTAVAEFYKDGVKVKDIAADSSALQYAVEGAPAQVTFVYDAKGTTEPGEYKLVVPEHMFQLNGMKSNAFEGTWTVLAPTKYTVNPAEGNVESLETIQITFPDYETAVNKIDNLTVNYIDPNHDNDKNISATVSCEGNVATIKLPEAASLFGTYRINVNAGSFALSNNGQTSQNNTAFTLSYNLVEGGSSITLLPAPGEVTVDELSSIVIKLPEGYTFSNSVNLNSKMMAQMKLRIYESDENGVVEGGFGASNFVGTFFNAAANGAALKTANETPALTFAPRMTNGAGLSPDKHYVVWLAKGVWMSKDGTNVNNPDVTTFNYSVVSAAFDLADVMSLGMPSKPDFTQAEMPYGPTMFGWYLEGQGYSLNAANTDDWSMDLDGEEIFTFKAKDYVELLDYKDPFDYGTGEASADGITAYAAEGQDTSACTLLIQLLSMDNASSLAQIPGAYTLHVPAGAILNNGNPNKPFSITYNYSTASYSGDDAYEFNPAAESKVANLKTIKITFPESTSVMYAGSGKVTLEGPDGLSATATYPTCVEGSFGDANNQSLVWNFSKVANWPDGTYTLTIPAGTLRINAPVSVEEPEANVPAIKVTWDVDHTVGVTLIGIEAADSYNVFSIDGAAIRLNGTVEDILNLEKGVYLINGQKVYIRK